MGNERDIVYIVLLLLPFYLMILSSAVYIGRTLSSYGMAQWVLNQSKKKKECDKNG